MTDLEQIFAAVSVLTHLLAATLALRQARITTDRRPWVFLATIIVLFAAWQSAVFTLSLRGYSGATLSINTAGLWLLLSMLLLVGVVWSAAGRQAFSLPEARDHSDTTQKRLRDILETLPVLLASADGKTGGFLFFDGAVQDIAGYSAEDFFRDTSLGTRVVHPEDREHVQRVYREGMASKKPFECEFRVVHGVDGRSVWLHSWVVPILAADGSLLRHDTVATDVTKQKEIEESLRTYREHLEELVRERTAELSQANKRLEDEIARHKQLADALQESERHYRTLVEHSLQGLVIVAGDPPRPVFANQAFADLLGYTVEEILSLSPEAVRNLVYAPDREAMFQRIRDRIAGKKTPSRYEFRAVRKDEEIRWMEIFAVRIEYKGQPAAHAVVVDITDRKRAEEALRHSEEQLRATLDSLGDAVHVVDHDLRILLVNDTQRKWYRGAGHGEDLVGRHLSDAFPSLSPEILNEYRRVFSTGEVLVSEKVSAIADKEYITEVRKIPVFENGRVARVVAVLRDITAQKYAERALRESEQKYRDLVQHSLQGVVIVQGSPPRVVFMNSTVSEFLGYTADEILAFSPNDMRKHIHPDDRDSIMQRLRDRLLGKTGPSRYEVRMIRKNGEVRWFEMYSSTIDYAGKTAAQGVFVDITERKRAEETLRESEQRYRTLFELSPSGIMVENARGDIIDVNPAVCQSLGYSKQELVGANVSQFTTDTPETIKENIDAILAGQRLSHVVADVRKDGTHRFVELHETKIPMPDGTDGVLVVSNDITARIRGEERLRRSEKTYREAIRASDAIPYRYYFGTQKQPAMYDFSGADAENLLGIPVEEAVSHEEFQKLVQEVVVADTEGAEDEPAHERAFQRGDIRRHRTDLRIRTPQGEIKWLSNSAIPLRDESTGEIVGSLGILQDITDRKRVEEKLREREESERRFREQLAALVSVGNDLSKTESLDELCRQAVELGREKLGFERLGVCFIDETGDFTVGTFGTDESGRTRDERGVMVSLNPEDQDAVRSEAAPRTIVEMSRELHDERGRTVGRGMHVYSGLWDGEDVTGFLNADNFLTGKPITDWQCELLSMYASTLGHLASRARAMETVRKSEEIYRKAIEAAEGIPYRLLFRGESRPAEFDFIGRGVESMLGISRDEATPERFAQLIEETLPGDNGSSTDAGAYEEAFRRGSLNRFHSDLRIRTPQGQIKWLSSSAVPIHDERTGRVTGSLGILQDITERKLAEERLRASEESERRFREQLATLVRVSNELAKEESLDALCRRAVELGREKLGVERLSICFLDEGKRNIVGTFGTDESRATRDERGMVLPIGSQGRSLFRLEGGPQMLVQEDTELNNDRGEPVGRGMHVFTALWDGEEIIGFLNADNLLTRAPITDRQCEILSMYASTLAHLSSRARAMEALRESEAKYRLLVENQTDLVVKIDPEGRFLFASPSFCKVVRKKEDDLLGQKLTSLTSSEDEARFRRAIQDVVRPPYTIELEHRAETHIGPRWLAWVGSAVLDENGHVDSIVAVGRDITDRKKMEERLRRNEEIYRRAIEAAEGVPFAMHADPGRHPLRFDYIGRNITPLLGVKREDLTPEKLTKMVEETVPTGQPAPRDVSEYDRAFREGHMDRYQADLRVRTPDGRAKWLSSAAVPLLDEQTGQVTGALGILQDITYRKQVEERLREREESERRFRERLATLVAIGNELYQAETFDDLCRLAVQLGHERLGLDRLGITLLDPDENSTVQTFGIDETGKVRDERGLRVPIAPETRELARQRGKLQTIVEHDTVLRNSRAEPVGRGTHVFASLWDGQQLIGFLNVDNLLTGEPFTEQECELVAMYASTLAHLASRARAMEALRKSEARYYSLFENCPISLAEQDYSTVHTFIETLRSQGVTDFRDYFETHPEAVEYCAENLEVLDVNTATVDLFEADSKQELQGAVNKIFCPESYERFKEELAAVAAGTDSFENETVTRTLKGNRKHLLLKWSQAPGYEKSTKRVYVSVADITRLKQAEESLRLLSSAVEQSTEGIAVTDLKGKIIFTNEAYANMHGFQIDDLADRHVSVLHAPEQHAAMERANRQVLDTGSFAGEVGHIRRDETAFPALLHNSLLRDEADTPMGIIETIRDISDLKKAEDELKRQRDQLQQFTIELMAARDQAQAANRAKTTFLANVSHELRTPLNSIIGFSNLVLRKSEGLLPEQQTKNLEKIFESANHLTTLIDGLLDMSKIEAGRMEVSPETFDFAELIRETATTIQPLIQANQNRLVTKIGKDLSRIHTDKMKLRQILLNLLSNAAKFTQNGRITLSANRTVPEGRKSAGDIDTVSITVRDQGIGMTQKQLAYVFDAFRQVDDSSTRRYGGTGLGLAISQRLAELLGGSIAATSEPGKGSTFTLNLPIQYRDIQEHGTDLPRR